MLRFLSFCLRAKEELYSIHFILFIIISAIFTNHWSPLYQSLPSVIPYCTTYCINLATVYMKLSKFSFPLNGKKKLKWSSKPKLRFLYSTYCDLNVLYPLQVLDFVLNRNWNWSHIHGCDHLYVILLFYNKSIKIVWTYKLQPKHDQETWWRMLFEIRIITRFVRSHLSQSFLPRMVHLCFWFYCLRFSLEGYTKVFPENGKQLPRIW